MVWSVISDAACRYGVGRGRREVTVMGGGGGGSGGAGK